MSTAPTEPASTVVRTASESDATAVAVIYAEHVRSGTASFDTVPRTIDETRQKISDVHANGWPFLVAERNGQVVGYAYVTQFRNRPAYGFACEDSIYVRADSVGLGVGSALLRALVAVATDCGFRQMIAVIGGGEPASMALHSRMGFVHAGTMRSVGRKFGQWLDSIYMQRPLGEGDSTPPEREPG